ncbi:MAG: SDR family NAD(P)-dependent oxidoreductase [Myxococcota bacterium]
MLQRAVAAGDKPTPAVIGREVAGIRAAREVRHTLQALEQAGAQARYLAVDASDAAAVGGALAQIREQWGPVGALVHGAGVLADKRIADKADDAFDRVYSVKVDGLRALLEATRSDPLSAIVLFSSVAGRCGNQGQVDYAMANEVLAKVAAREARRRPDAIVRALQWGPWAGGMVTKELASHFASAGVPLIPLEVGARWFVEELSDRLGATEVVLGGEPRMEPLAGGDGPQPLRLRTRLDHGSAPYLADHVVAGKPVVPVVMVLEWFARAAAAARPDLVLTGFRDLRVLRGVRLDHFDSGGDWFDVVVTEVSNGSGAVLALELRDLQGRPLYSAQGTLAAVAATAPPGPAARQLPAWSGEAIYDGQVLFHGDAFRVIRHLDGISDAGVDATLASTRAADWPAEPWRTDPAALDGGLQLALLWSHRVLGGPSLPMGVGAYRTFRTGPPEGTVRAVLTGERRGRDKTVSDILLIDEQTGEVVSELRGVEAILRPS